MIPLLGFTPDIDPTTPGAIVDCANIVPTTNGNLLFYCPPQEWSANKSGFFTTIGSEISLPTGCSSEITLVYWKKPAALTLDADTNSVLDTYYGIYLHAAVKQAMMYIRDASGAASAQVLLDVLLTNATSQPMTAGPLHVRPA